MSDRSIICAFDASETARLAASTAGWLANALAATLEIVYVLDAGGVLVAAPREGAGADPVLRARVYELQADRLRERMLSELAATASSLDGVQVTFAVHDGLPVPTLHALAAERRAALLVSGTAARGGFERVLCGSVSGSLVADAPCPVVTVPPAAQVGDAGPVLACDDGSDHARRAVLHADALADRLRRDVVRMRVDDGDPVETIASAGHEQRACLIVTGTRGRGPVRTALFGSVSTGLVRSAARPVVLVPLSAGDPA
jgi:nucleotide-binding universal stress UspA family protein